MSPFVRASPFAGALIALALLSGAPRAGAQERPEPRAEVARLERLLQEVEAALAKLRPVTQPELTWLEYDLRVLFKSAPDRRAPSLELSTPDAGTQTAAGASFSFEGAEEAPFGTPDPDEVEELLRASFLAGHPATLQFEGGFLQLETTAANHALARALIAELRAERLRCVQVEIAVYSLPTALQAELEAANVESGGRLSAATLARLDAAVARGEGKLVDAALLSALAGQSVYFHRGLERSYVADLERSSGGTGQIVETVTDPVVSVLRTGLALEVRPSFAAGGDELSLDLRASRADLVSMDRRATPYGSVDVPSLRVTTTRTTTRVALGGGVLVSASRKAALAPRPGEEGQAERSVLIVVRPR